MMKQKTYSPVQVHTGELVLVNGLHPLPENHIPAGMAFLTRDTDRRHPLANCAAKMLELLLATIDPEGIIQPVSGYRTRADQSEIYTDTLRQKGEEYTRKYVALPGCSEHETGLAIDLKTLQTKGNFICPGFSPTGKLANFHEKAAAYGFVLRYPENKTHITGIAYEPWHFRYVGWPHAQIMFENGLVLEEYLTLLQTHTGPENALCFKQGGRSISIFTTHAEDAAEAGTQLARAGKLWQVSGNNIDGMVFTVWM